MLTTAFTELVGCTVPIQLAAMGGGITTPELVAAVCRAGGLGMLQRGNTRPFADLIAEVEGADARPYGVNFVPAIGQDDRAEIELAASRAWLVEFFYSDPDPSLVELVHTGGALAGWQVGSTEEAVAAVEAGCDLVIAQGVEAGGHVRGATALRPLLAGVVDAVAVPVVAAGGITTARAMADALEAGAAAVRLGTRFLATPESGAHADYIAALLGAGADDTVLTAAFSIGWPDAPHRVLASAVAAAKAFDGELVGTLTVAGEARPLPRFAARTPSREVEGAVAAMALYAGRGVGDVTRVTAAAEIVAELSQGAERLLDERILTRWQDPQDREARRRR